ncbi:hypothetical protein FSP39_023222 [Pinctada imbricata]|uniref:BTB domain-containing protein n=1 Tax=Pinctada imbricata TaxID=66713 RepID=A0AA89C5U9_PINIB|nr:hypothetical protein FSP39_023222 [Pinctada imbricata]
MTSSPVFKAMFLGNFKEKTSTEIPLPEKNNEDMVAFLNCLLQDEENKLTGLYLIDDC